LRNPRPRSRPRLRHQPGSKLTQEYRRCTLNASKRIKRIAIVALARKLIVALWRYLTTGLVPEGATLKAIAYKSGMADSGVTEAAGFVTKGK